MTSPDGGNSLEPRVAQLEGDLATVIWLHAELSYAWRLATAQQIAQALQPTMQQAIMDRLMGASA